MKVSVSVSRDSRGEIVLRVVDEVSRTNFLEIFFTPEQFATAITGLYTTDIEAVVDGLNNVGKKKVRENRFVLMSRHLSKEQCQQTLKDLYQEDGWTLDYYLGSQKSIEYIPQSDMQKVNYTVFKYVEVE